MDTKHVIHLPQLIHTYLIKAIPYLQALRVKCICMAKKDQMRELCTYILEIGNIKKKYCKSLEPLKTVHKPAPLTKVVTYYPNNPNYATAVNKIWNKQKKYLPGKLVKSII